MLWLVTGFVLLVLSAWRGGLNTIAGWFGVTGYPPAVLFAVATLFILAVLLHYSTVISKLADQNVILAQRLALLEQRVEAGEKREVRGRLGRGAPAGRGGSRGSGRAAAARRRAGRRREARAGEPGTARRRRVSRSCPTSGRRRSTVNQPPSRIASGEERRATPMTPAIGSHCSRRLLQKYSRSVSQVPLQRIERERRRALQSRTCARRRASEEQAQSSDAGARPTAEADATATRNAAPAAIARRRRSARATSGSTCVTQRSASSLASVNARREPRQRDRHEQRPGAERDRADARRRSGIAQTSAIGPRTRTLSSEAAPMSTESARRPTTRHVNHWRTIAPATRSRGRPSSDGAAQPDEGATAEPGHRPLEPVAERRCRLEAEELAGAVASRPRRGWPFGIDVSQTISPSKPVTSATARRARGSRSRRRCRG